MKTRPCTGTVRYLKVGRKRHWFVEVDILDQKNWPFPSDAFVISRNLYRNKHLQEGDRVMFMAVERNGDLVAWKIKREL